MSIIENNIVNNQLIIYNKQINHYMDASNENVTLLSRDLDSNSEMTFKHRVFNFYYQTLRKKSISLLLLTFFMIFETVELVSYAFIEAYRPVWKVKESSMDYIQLILGATRITPLMKYLKFDFFIIIFILRVSAYINCIFP